MIEELLSRYYQTYNSEDSEALRAFYHPDVELVSAQGTMSGVEAVLDTYRGLISMFHDKMTPESIVVEGEHARVLISDSFTAKQDVPDFMGMSLKAGETRVMKLKASYHIRDGRIARVEVYPSDD